MSLTFRISPEVARDMRKLCKMAKVNQKWHAFTKTLTVAKKTRFRSQCFVCNSTANENTYSFGWTFHHLWYNPNDLNHRHFKPLIRKKPNPEFIFSGLDDFEGIPVKKVDMHSLYRLEVLRQVRNNPRQFRFIDSAHHQAVEKLDRFKPDNVKSLIKLWKETKTRWRDK